MTKETGEGSDIEGRDVEGGQASDSVSSETKSSDPKEAELNDAFKRLEKQVEENRAQEKKSQPKASKQKVQFNQSAESNPQSKGPGMNITSAIALLFSLVALGVGSYGAYTTWTLQQSQDDSMYGDQISLLNGELTKLQASLGQSNQQIEDQLQSILETQKTVESNLDSRLAEGIAELRAQAGTSSEDWLLAEAEYLLRLANQRVVMEDDVAGAIALFEAADQIIRDAQGVVAFALRQAIASDIASLKGVSGSDIDGIFVQLGAISKQVQSLEQKYLKFESVDLPAIEVEQDATFLQKTQSVLGRTVDRVLSLVDYRNDGEVITPILPPAEEYYLKQNLILKIQLAQLGLLEGNQRIYEQSLSDSVVWVDQYFNAESSLTISVRDSLAELKSQVIERDLPDVSGSLREIRKLMTNFHQAGERTES